MWEDKYICPPLIKTASTYQLAFKYFQSTYPLAYNHFPSYTNYMNYELARAFKENMFKQNGMGYYITRLNKPLKTSAKSFCQVEGKKPYVPVLHELIEAIGDEWFDSLHCTNGGDWVAYGGDKKGQGDDASGSTPEEAVAKLWLAINQK